MDDYVLITFQSQRERVDLRVPGFVKVAELLDMLADALSFPRESARSLQAEPLGRILDPDKTLDEEQVTEGSLLTLV